MTSFYVASRFSDYKRVRLLCEHLREVEVYTITHDWTITDEFGPDGNLTPASQAKLSNNSATYAKLDYYGASMCDIFIFLADLNDYKGAFVEMGIALASGAEVFVVAPSHECVFYHLPNVTIFDSIEELEDELGVFSWLA